MEMKFDSKEIRLTVEEAKKTWKTKKITFGEGYEDCKYYQVDTIEIKEYIGDEENVEIPSYIGKKPVAAIGSNAFAGNTKLKQITIPENVFIIEDNAFEGCSNLESVTILGNQIRIGSTVFSNCCSLSSFTSKAESIRLGYLPFKDCTKLMDSNRLIIIVSGNERILCGIKQPIQEAVVTIPDGVTQIAGHVFSYKDTIRYTNNDVIKDDLRNLRKVILPVSVHTIATLSFRAEKLQEVVLPEGVEEIHALAFCDCDCLRELHMPSTIKNLAPNFVQLNNGSAVTLYCKPGGYVEDFVHKYGKYYNFAEENSMEPICDLMKDFVAEDGWLIKYLGIDSTVVIPDNVEVIGRECFAGKNSVSSVIIPNGVKQIELFAFKECKKLEEVSFPDTLKEIGDFAFSECVELKKVVLLDNIEYIGEYAFSCCSSLAEVHLPRNIENIGDCAFQQIIKKAELTIYAPVGSYAETYAKENNIPFVAE